MTKDSGHSLASQRRAARASRTSGFRAIALGVAATRAVNDTWVTRIALDNALDKHGAPRSVFRVPVELDGSERAARIESDLASGSGAGRFGGERNGSCGGTSCAELTVAPLSRGATPVPVWCPGVLTSMQPGKCYP